MQTPLDECAHGGYIYNRTRKDCPTVNESDKKRKIPLQTYITTAEDLKEATEIITAVEGVLQSRSADLRFDHILLWWLSCDTVEA